MKRIISLILVLTVIAGTFVGCGNNNTTNENTDVDRPVFNKETKYSDISNEEFVLCAEEGDLKLYFMPSTTHFMVENIKDGSVWYSNPQNVEEDEYAKKTTQMQMMSTLVIDSINIETKKENSLNLYTAVVRSKKYSISLVDDGVLFKYDVADIGKAVYLAVRLNNAYLSTDVWYESLEKTKENVYVSAVKVTPYFVSGKLGEDGYLFVPDGSGALVEYNTDNITSSSYSRPIYGEEPTNITRDWYLNAKNEPVRLPVFGAVKNGSAVVAIAETGAENGTINAFACGQTTSYANVFVSYGVLNSVEYDLGTYSTVIYDKNEKIFPTVTTRYYFLSGEDANYSGMARQYSEYLKDTYSLKEIGVSNTFYTDVFGGVIKRVSTFGVPHDKFVSLTTADELQTMINTLKDNGVSDITVRYRSWNLDELRGDRVNSNSVDNDLSFNKLNKINGAKVYPAVLELQSYSNGGFFDALSNASFTITGLPFSAKGFLKSNLRENDEVTYWVAASELKDNIHGVVSSLDKKDFSAVAFGDISNSLYSDYSDNGYMRDYSKIISLTSIKDAKDRLGSIMTDAANDYAAVLSDVIYNAPISHSNQNILSKTVPFYTMALGSFTNCVAPLLNGEKSNDNLLLAAASSGVYIGYAFMHEKASELVSTEFKALSNMNFDSNLKEAISSYNKMQEIYSAANGSNVWSHEYVSDTLTKTKYENGTEVLVNFSNADVNVGTTVVPAKSFVVIGGK